MKNNDLAKRIGLAEDILNEVTLEIDDQATEEQSILIEEAKEALEKLYFSLRDLKIV